MNKKLNSCSLLLMIFYCFVFFTLLNPKVSKEYEDYYIRKTSSLSPTMIESKLAEKNNRVEG